MIDRNLEGTWWWGYLHSNGTVQLKRWFGDHEDYTGDVEGNDFVVQVVRPFKEDSDERAWDYVCQKLGRPVGKPAPQPNQ